jgi:hypothetical protein
MQHVRQPLPELICVPPGMVRQIFPLVVEWLDQGYAAADEYLPDDLLPWLERGAGQLWIATREGLIVAALTTSLVKARCGLVCRMVGAGGTDVHSWKRFHYRIEEYARAEGCVKVVSEGRPGWARVLEGYRITRLCLEKEV